MEEIKDLINKDGSGGVQKEAQEDSFGETFEGPDSQVDTDQNFDNQEGFSGSRTSGNR